MQERDEALDFIYKGFRDGRQYRRNVMNQRGADRIAARRERMAQYGSPSMQMQTPKMRGPPSRRNVASSPPSSEPYVNPVQQYLEREGLQQPQEQTSSTTTGNFTDDISTLDDESTPINEAAGSPPSMSSSMPLETAMANLDLGMGGTGATRSTYNPTSPKPTQAMMSPTEPPIENQTASMTLDEARGRLTPKPEAAKTEPKRRDLGDAGEIIDGNISYNQDGVRVPENPAPVGMGEGPYKETRPTVRPAKDPEPPKELYKPPEMPFMKPSVEGYKLRPITTLKPDGGSGEAVAPKSKTATLTPVKQLKPVEQQHKESFETAYEEMRNEATQPDKTEPSKEERAQEMFNRVQNRKSERLGEEPEYEIDDSKLTDKDKKAMAAFEKVQDRKKKREAKKKEETPKPDKTVSNAAKKKIKPTKKATEKGKSAVRAASDRLARSGMKGDTKDESPKE